MKRIFIHRNIIIATALLCNAANTNAAVNDNDIIADNVVNFCKATGDYVNYSTPLNVPAGKTYAVVTSRYSYWTSQLTGSGRLDIYSGGERCYLGTSKGAYYPNWTGFKGEAHLYPYKKVVSNCGFYGLIWGHGGKTFNSEEPEASINSGKVNNCFSKCSLTLHSGTALATESGTRGIRIAHLDMEEGSQLYGYYKNSNTPKTYYVVGCDNTDATLAGRISPMGDNLQMGIGLIKEGTGTYRITGNTNSISGGLRVLGGTVLANNNAAKAQTGKMQGAVGPLYKATDTGVFVMEQGTIGGNGSISATTDVYGCIEPGDNGTGTLTFKDFVKGNAVTLRVRPTTKINMEIASSTDYDKIVIDGSVEYYNICQDFSRDTKMPTIRITLADDASLKVGDSFVLLTAKGHKSLDNIEWQWNISYPKSYTWKVEEQKEGTSVKVVATVVSLDNGNQGSDDDNKDDDEEKDDYSWDYAKEKSYTTTSIKGFANYLHKYVGVAVRGWSMDLNNSSDAQASLIANEFNAVVAENEMKYDATEPEQGIFNFADGDKLVNFAERHKMRVRGHTLAWHSQLPGWLTTEGTKNTFNRSREELLALLKNHIMNVVGRWKGRIAEWDVANEILDDNQSVIRSNPDAYTLRPSVWKTGIGEDFVDSAFVWAHQADPDALLFLNDYEVEFKGQAKTEAFYNLVKRMLDSNIPIHGVGLQCHLNAGKVDYAKLKANIKRYKDLGLVCNITELDLGIDDTSEASLMQQANDYNAITRIFLGEDNSTTLIIWGLKDTESWRSSSPLLYNGSLTAKPAYYGVRAALHQGYTDFKTAVDDVCNDDASDQSPWYDLTGRKVEKPSHGIYLHKGRKIFVR